MAPIIVIVCPSLQHLNALFEYVAAIGFMFIITIIFNFEMLRVV